ncbi:hypothetical protein [Amycolatopsis aidingensis]|uniref:hypothetical protein n=1 Tax=Amycolatopsis aidingensis TaxID=2842453 RepID=UPI0038CC16F2
MDRRAVDNPADVDNSQEAAAAAFVPEELDEPDELEELEELEEEPLSEPPEPLDFEDSDLPESELPESDFSDFAVSPLPPESAAEPFRLDFPESERASLR